MRSINYTFMNNGTPFVFRVDKMTKHPFREQGATMLKVHAILTLEGQNNGDNVALLDTTGRALTRSQLRSCARTGQVPEPPIRLN